MATVDHAIGICTVCGSITHIPAHIAEKMQFGESTAGRCALAYLADTGPETCLGEVQFWGYIQLHYPRIIT